MCQLDYGAFDINYTAQTDVSIAYDNGSVQKFDLRTLQLCPKT